MVILSSTMMFRGMMFSCVLALVLEPIMCAPLIETGQVAARVDDENVEKAIEERSTTNKIYDEEFAANYLKMYGYWNLGISKNSLGGKNSDELKESLKRMQTFFKLNVTGELNEETLALMNSPRCSLPDIIRGAGGRQKRYRILERWRSNQFTYRLLNYPSHWIGFSNTSEIDFVIDKGLKIWTQHANLNISKSLDSTANLELAFYRGDHGDNYPFDGRGNYIAHAREPEVGEIHFDDDEYWSKYDYGINLEQVAAHEAGHALGLLHTNDRKALMFPHYFYNRNFKLGDDDIRGIQHLYGPRSQTTGDYLQDQND